MPPKRHARQLSFSDIEHSVQSTDVTNTSISSIPQPVEDLPFAEVSSFPPFSDIEHGELFTLRLSNDTSSLTHSLHRFPAKFIPQIPRWAISQFAGEGACILDPFMGSGTTLVEGLLHSGCTIGVDIDPLARLIARAKTEMPSVTRLVEVAEEIASRWTTSPTDLHAPMPDIVNFGHWFSTNAWGQLQLLLHLIRTVDCSDSERRFLLVVFSSILRWVSNADDQTQKTYVSGTLRKQPPDVRETFWRSFQRALRGLNELHVAQASGSQVSVLETGDATALALPDSSVDLVVTSPPYLDSVDYMYNLMLEYFWLGPLIGVPNRKAYNARRRATLGAKSPTGQMANIPEELKDLVDLDHMPVSRRVAAVAYFQGMSTHFAEAARVMRPGARYILVVGNSQTMTNIIPIHDCLIRLAASQGLALEKAFAMRVRRHYMKFPRGGRGGIILIDWIVVLRKTEGPAVIPARLPLPWATLGDRKVAN